MILLYLSYKSNVQLIFPQMCYLLWFLILSPIFTLNFSLVFPLVWGPVRKSLNFCFSKNVFIFWRIFSLGIEFLVGSCFLSAFFNAFGEIRFLFYLGLLDKFSAKVLILITLSAVTESKVPHSLFIPSGKTHLSLSLYDMLFI